LILLRWEACARSWTWFARARGEGRGQGGENCGGRIRTGVKRLMRPCWDQAPVHSADFGNQYSRQDSNLRSTPCEGGAVAAGPRECFCGASFQLADAFRQAGTCPSVVPAGFEPAISTMSGWRALHCSTRLVGPAGVEPAWYRVSYGCLAARSPARVSKDGRSRTLCMRVGAALLSHEHVPVHQLPRQDSNLQPSG
jgi:hypothetical protein